MTPPPPSSPPHAPPTSPSAASHPARPFQLRDTLLLSELTTEEVAHVSSLPAATVLLPLGSVEPHGPHLPLGTDTLLSEHSAMLGAQALRDRGIAAYIAPTLPYGVTNFAQGFAGAISVPATALVSLLRAIVGGFLHQGFAHVCLVNHHLEPEHDRAVREVTHGFPDGSVSVACPLTRRWGRLLGEEFRSGACHAGQYETSLVLATGHDVREQYTHLAPVTVSLSQGIADGKTSFRAMGMTEAYTGSPAQATKEEGRALFDRITEMIVGEVTEALERAPRSR